MSNLNELLDTGDYASAELVVSRLLSTGAVQSPADYCQIGRLRLRQGRSTEAVDAFIAAARGNALHPDVVEAGVARLLEIKDSANAAIISALGIILHPKDARCVFAHGRTLSTSSLHELAEPAFRRATKLSRTTERYARELGLCLLRLHRWSDAKEALDDAEKIDPEKAQVRSWLPADILEKARVAIPNWSWPAYQLGIIRYEERKYPEAEKEFLIAAGEANQKAPLNLSARALLADCIRRSRPKNEAISAIQKLIEKYDDADRPWHHLYLGLLASAEGQLSVADSHFSRLKEKPVDVLQVSQGATTFAVEPNPMEREVLVDLSSARKNVSDEDQYVVFAVGDGRYIALFAEAFVGSVLHVAGDRPIHLHIINANEDSSHAISRIRSALPRLRLSVSSETVDYPLPRPYYAMSRFLLAPHLLKLVNKPLFVVDIDATLEKDIGDHMSEFRDFDVVVKMNKSMNLEFPWMQIFATSLIFMPSDGAMLFLKKLENYFWDRFDATGISNSWWIDQNALFYAHRKAQESGDCRILDFGDSSVDKAIVTNLPQESKFDFVRRMKERWPLDKVQSVFPTTSPRSAASKGRKTSAKSSTSKRSR